MFDNWKWLAGTYWYVPAACLRAPLFAGNETKPVWMSDQTVWQITGYENGYFWGNVAVSLAPEVSSEPPQPTAQVVMASVTPEGDLHMTFMPADGSGGSQATVGIGRMRWRDGAWAAEMQMSTTPSDGTVILHWAYMLQCIPGDAAWEQLPGTSQSVPDFLASAGIQTAEQATQGETQD